MPAKQLRNHKVTDILITPVREMTGDGSNQVDVKRTLLYRKVDAAGFCTITLALGVSDALHTHVASWIALTVQSPHFHLLLP